MKNQEFAKSNTPITVKIEQKSRIEEWNSVRHKKWIDNDIFTQKKVQVECGE